MGISRYLHDYLRNLLEAGPLSYPQPATLPGLRPHFRQCHIVAEMVQNQRHWPMVVGIQFLDLFGKLYPWPHVVNQRDGQLLDFSGGADQPFLGYVVTGFDQVNEFNAIVAAYDTMNADQQSPRWTDPLAQSLSDDFLERLRSVARFPPRVDL
jgi:hypothetical protein